MDPPPVSIPPPIPTTISAVASTTAPPPPSQHPPPDSTNSTPHSRTTDSLEDPPTTTTTTAATQQPAPSSKLRLMCSYGGHIIPRPHDKTLCYIGGDTRIIVVDRHTSLSEFRNRLSKTIFKGKPFALKYQLPNEDLDSLISLSTDDDLENMIEEYDRINSSNPKASKTSRLRLFLFPDKTESSISSIESLLESSTKSEDWFLEALNGISFASQTSAYSESNSSVNCLLGLDDVVQKQQQPSQQQQPLQQQQQQQLGGGMDRDPSDESLTAKDRKDLSENNHDTANNVQDVHSVPDSPMLDRTSSFGSASSTPSLTNLPPIRVHVEDSGQGQKIAGVLGIEEQFNQMTAGVGAGGVPVAGSSPPAPVMGPVVTGLPVMGGGGGGGGGGEYVNRVISDDERSDQGVPVGYRKIPQLQHQVLPQHPQQPAQFQQKPAGFVDLPSPDSVSSDGSVTNPLSRQKQMVFQDQIMHMQSGNNRTGANVVVVDQKINDPNSRGQMQQQVQESEYVMPSVYEQHPRLHHQQQFVHAGVQYIHSHTAGGMPIASYYPMYHSQQQPHPPHQGAEQQFVYYMPPASRPAQAYSLPVQQQSFGESPTAAQASRPQTPPHPTALVNPAAAYNAMNVPISKPETAAGVYRTAATGGPQLVQVQSSQHHPQYVGYQVHHPSQSIRPSSGASPNYAYEYSEPTHPQIYYTQPMAPQMTAQYQTVTSSPMVMLPGNAAQVPIENIKQQNSNSHL